MATVPSTVNNASHFDIFNSTNSQTIDELSCEARHAISYYTRGPYYTQGEDVIFMREFYIRKQLKQDTGYSHDTKKQGSKYKKDASKQIKKELGPFNHIWNLFVFIRNSDGKIQRLHFNREYKDNLVEGYIPYCLEFGFTEDDIRMLQRAITSNKLNEVSVGMQMLSI
jgi:hypothetical protein